MYYVYILKSSKTGKYYIGYTSDLKKRLNYHNNGRTPSLRKHIPLGVARIEEFRYYDDARKRERQIKSYKSGEAFKRLLKS
ncbi:MAG: GIY-YIG nuclease family protein [Patescibacteria group bacterium]|nr:GIY-YIG nuclease family protein [Patescibacteria group bacterium]MDE2015582.1 GIY-YIG nuclease family protein [Patescibacteria group bacterium]MDE2227222.1 GIY-YIG nuclease family protein [Patescibacteria group bacterium]